MIVTQPRSLNYPSGTVLAVQGGQNVRNWNGAGVAQYSIITSGPGQVALQGTNDVAFENDLRDSTSFSADLIPPPTANWTTIVSGSGVLQGSINTQFAFYQLIVLVQDVGSCTQAWIRWWARSLKNPSSGTLPATPQAAFSFRKVIQAYTGPSMNIRRSSDNTTLDIGFDANGNFDLTSFNTFVAAGSGFVTKWYDQSGLGNNLVQVTQANQPLVVTSEARLGNNPVMQSSAGAQFLRSTTGASTSAHSICVVGAIDTLPGAATDAAFAFWSGTNTTNRNSAIGARASNPWFGGAGQDTNYFDSGTTLVTTNGNVYIKMYNGSAVIGDFNGTNDVGPINTTYSNMGADLGVLAQFSAGTGGMTGRVGELVFYKRALTAADIATCEASMKAYWGTP